MKFVSDYSNRPISQYIDIKEVWQHHIVMNTNEGNHVGIIIFTTYYYNIYKHTPFDCSSTSGINFIELLHI